jgi:hypothetical protein
VELLPPVSAEAMHLINCLLRPKRIRLCSKIYRENERKCKRPSSRQTTELGHKAYFVFENDASDIKFHSFFRGVNWNELHLERPPFIPHIRGDEPITRYFEEEKDILGSWTESALTLNNDDEQSLSDMPPDIAQKMLFLRQCPNNIGYKARQDVLAWLAEHNPLTVKSLVKPPKRRARDKILRDGKCGKEAMLIRKRYAFLGYTYRRPNCHTKRMDSLFTVA